MNNIGIIGAGGHGKVVLDALYLCDPNVSVQIYDDNPAKHNIDFLGLTVQAPFDQNLLPDKIHLAIGNNVIRKIQYESLLSLGKSLITIQHPRAIVSANAKSRGGVFFAANCIVAPNAEVGLGVIVNHGAIVDHDCNVGDWVHIAPNAVLGGGVTIGDSCLIGSSAVILPGVKIGHGAVIGAGAVVTRNVEAEAVVAGVPAKLLR